MSIEYSTLYLFLCHHLIPPLPLYVNVFDVHCINYGLSKMVLNGIIEILISFMKLV